MARGFRHTERNGDGHLLITPIKDAPREIALELAALARRTELAMSLRYL
jgi:hypothetical protein